MNKKYKDYSQRFLSFEPENRDITPYILIAGVNEEQQDEFMNLIYVPYGTTSEEEAYVNNNVRVYGKEYTAKAKQEVFEKCQRYEELENAPFEASKKAKTVSTIFTAVTALLLVASLVLTFI